MDTWFKLKVFKNKDIFACAEKLLWHTSFLTQSIFLRIKNIIIPSAESLRKCCRQRLFQHNKSEKMSRNDLLSLEMATRGWDIICFTERYHRHYIKTCFRDMVNGQQIQITYKGVKVALHERTFSISQSLKNAAIALRLTSKQVNINNRYCVSLCVCRHTWISLEKYIYTYQYTPHCTMSNLVSKYILFQKNVLLIPNPWLQKKKKQQGF